MRSKIAQRILDSTPDSVRDGVRERTNKLTEEIKDNNEILHRFMGFKGEEIPNYIGGLQYHNSMDHLQPVIDKISSYLLAYPEPVRRVTKLPVTTKIGIVYERCVEFVRSLNNGDLDSKTPQDLAVEMAQAIQWFCDRVDRGEVRSKRSYKRFKEILNKLKPINE
jgi:hypothetical protein